MPNELAVLQIEMKNIFRLFKDLQDKVSQMKKEIAKIERSIKYSKRKYYDKKLLEKEFLNKKVIVKFAFSGSGIIGTLTKIFDDGLLLDNRILVNAMNIATIKEVEKEIVHSNDIKNKNQFYKHWMKIIGSQGNFAIFAIDKKGKLEKKKCVGIIKITDYGVSFKDDRCALAVRLRNLGDRSK